MTNIMDNIQRIAKFREAIKNHPGMASSDPERLGRFWGERPNSTGQRAIAAALVADAMEMSDEDRAAFDRGFNSAIHPG